MPLTSSKTRLLLLSSALALPFFSPLFGGAAFAQSAQDPETTQTVEQNPNEEVQQETRPVDISGPGSVDEDEVIVVQGRFIPEPVRASSEVLNVLDAEAIARSGEGDIASALQRVTGLSLVGGRFVYVRGLGDRYSLALLNGSPLPSPEPQRRVVPLDIFPTSVIASSVVQKSYSVAYPGEFGGGVINLTTLAVPEETFLTVGAGIGANTETTGELGYTYFGSDTDFLGFDDGSRDIPDALRAAFAAEGGINRGPNFSLEQLEGITAALNNASTTIVQRNDDIPINGSLELTAGTAIDIGDDRLGVIANIGWDNSWQTRGGTQQFTTGLDGDNTLVPTSDFEFLATQNRIVVNGLLGFGYEFGEHKIRWTNLYIRDSLKEARLDNGFASVVGDNRLLRQRTTWFERQLIDTQLVAEFDFGDFGADIRASYAKTERESPYERSFSYEFNPEIGDFVNDLRSNGQNATIAFSELQEDLYAGAVDLSYNVPAAFDMTLSAGYSYSDTSRNSFRRSFVYRSDRALPSTIAQARPDYLTSDFVVREFDVLLREQAAGGEVIEYDAGLEIHGVYAQVEAEPIDFVRGTLGVRYETATQTIDTFDIFGGVGTGGDASLVNTRLENDYFLPAGTLTWNFADDMQFRLAASKTIARPQFRELAPQQFLDIESNRTFIGNQFLRDSSLINAEARFEWYPGRNETISLAGFYKNIDNPIEAVAFVQGEAFFTTFANAPEAQLYGAELEVQKRFTVADTGFFETRDLVLVANYTYTKSEIKVGNEQVLNNEGRQVAASTLFTDGEPLTGQSDHLINLQIGFEDSERLSQQTLLLNYASERVTSRFVSATSGGGIAAIPFKEDPGFQLDFVVRQGIELGGIEAELKLEARNILGEDYEEFQEFNGSRLDRNVFERGRSFAASIGVTF
ncbi:TonB-dependent receptor [Pacificimonas sp. WHA3]|uniref:TonB-dependent receptor n=1 Tax=Pacificimonas pallii TaxID=2827236 RepID=A0ABS6SHS8_9SPHN|nr:TonB-dependent receptor [Pacificimonas pallii]MBV7257805.1 TonB-dependent receptor [Pacificimonas pallii]